MTNNAIVLICHDAPFGRAMAAALHDRFGLGLVGVLAISQAQSRRTKLRRYVARIFKTSRLEKQILGIERKLEKAAAQAFAIKANPPADWPSGVVVRRTDNPNRQSCVAWLENFQTSIIAVTGAPILRPDVFKLARLGTLNMHSSLLPDYRGSHAEFWQVLEDRLDRAGVTIHYVDDGVDTGQIISQQATEAGPQTSPQMLRTLNLIAAIEEMPDAIERVFVGNAFPRPQEQGDGITRKGRDRTLTARAQLLAKLGLLSAGRLKDLPSR